MVLLNHLRRLLALLSCLLISLSNTANTAFNGDVYPFESTTKVVGFETLTRSQGVTTDGEAWIFSGKSALIRTSMDGDEILAANLSPFKGLEHLGLKHVGGISCRNGVLLAAMEDSKVWKNPTVAVFDAETLAFTGRYHTFPNELFTDGLPWVAFYGEDFLVADCNDTDRLYQYRLSDFSLVREIPLSVVLDEIQGGEVWEDTLYVGTNDPTRAVYAIRLTDGEVTKLFDRISYQPKLIDNFGGEGEDLTVLPMEDGTFLHTLDVGALFIDANLRHYKIDPIG